MKKDSLYREDCFNANPHYETELCNLCCEVNGYSLRLTLTVHCTRSGENCIIWDAVSLLTFLISIRTTTHRRKSLVERRSNAMPAHVRSQVSVDAPEKTKKRLIAGLAWVAVIAHGY